MPTVSSAQINVGISVRVGPPPIPVYAQPICPGAGFIWTPGYWAWGTDGYYWVPGTWVMAPRSGFLWTPGYWGWRDSVYVWHPGYWGPHVGFYGGINYGFGYGGVGYSGGYWNRGVFNYNRAVSNVNVSIIHNTYNRTVVVNNTNRVSYNGGAGGIGVRPTRAEESAAREQHVSATSMQMQHERAAGTNRSQLASVNHGRPGIAATARPGEFNRRPNNVNRPAPGNMNRNENGARPERAERPNAAPQRNNERPNAAPQRNNQRPSARPNENAHPDHGGDRPQGNDRQR
ncbi:MAG: YXWGXW repeat-containing protein [Candidatus Acidiferrales bacterium]